MSECPLAHSDAAYVLGSLSPADRMEFERHLPGCERCRRSVTELAGLPGLLGRVPREQVEAPLPFEPLPATVLPALVAAVRREQRRKARAGHARGRGRGGRRGPGRHGPPGRPG